MFRLIDRDNRPLVSIAKDKLGSKCTKEDDLHQFADGDFVFDIYP